MMGLAQLHIDHRYNSPHSASLGLVERTHLFLGLIHLKVQ